MSEKAKTPKRGTDRKPAVRFDEANLGRLGLISILERIPEDAHKWEVRFEVDGRPARIACVGTPEFGGYPHGLDNDVSGALVNLYIEAGAPEGGWFHTTAYRVLQRAGLQTTGRYYDILRTSLLRLRSTTYYMTDSWYDVRHHHITASFNYVEKLEYTSDDDELHLSGASILKIRLAPEITASIRAKYIRPLDEALLANINRPPTRALYRLLEGRRTDPLLPAEPLSEFTVNVREWAQACKILDPKPARIKRILEPSHQDLLRLGYLTAVEFGGTRTAQTVTYRFQGAQLADNAVSPDPALVQRLGAYGVSAKVALELIGQLGEAHVRERSRKFEAIVQGGYQPKKPSGMLLDVIRDRDGKYPDPPGYVPLARVQEGAHAKARREAREEQALAQRDADLEARQRAKPLEAQIDDCLHTLQRVFAPDLTTRDYARLREKFERGLSDPVTLAKQALLAAFDRKAERFIEDLRSFIGQ